MVMELGWIKRTKRTKHQLAFHSASWLDAMHVAASCPTYMMSLWWLPVSSSHKPKLTLSSLNCFVSSTKIVTYTISMYLSFLMCDTGVGILSYWICVKIHRQAQNVESCRFLRQELLLSLQTLLSSNLSRWHFSSWPMELLLTCMNFAWGVWPGIVNINDDQEMNWREFL